MPRIAIAAIALLVGSVLSLASASEFRIEGPSGAERVTIFETGDIHIALGEIQEGSIAELTEDPLEPEFIIQDPAGNVILRIPGNSGDLNLAGSIHDQMSSPLVPPQDSFIIENSLGQIVAYVDTAGNLVTLGRVFLHGRQVDRVTGGGAWGGHANDVDFNDFTDMSGIVLDGEAFQDGSTLVVNDTSGVLIGEMNIRDVRVGAAWLSEKIPLDDGFRVNLDFTIHHGQSTNPGGPIDFSESGFALVIQNQSATPTLHSGLHQDCGPDPNTADCEGEMGYTGITKGIAIEFDSQMNNNRDEIDNPHTISVQACSPLTSNHDDCSVASVLLDGPDFQRQVELDPPVFVPRLKGTHSATIDYNKDNTLRVYMDGELALTVSDFDLPEVVNGTDVWIGVVGSSPPEPLAQRNEMHGVEVEIPRPLVIGLSGERGLSMGLLNELEAHGLNGWLSCLNPDEFESKFFSEEGVQPDGHGVVYDNFLRPRILKEHQGIRFALAGHSHGGGAVYKITQRLFEDIFPNPEAIDVFMTAYVDAIENDTNFDREPQTALPLAGEYHVNLYQTLGTGLGSLVGAPGAIPADFEIDVNTMSCVDAMNHTSIDSCIVVHELLTTHLRHAAFGTPVNTPSQICGMNGMLCNEFTGEHSCLE